MLQRKTQNELIRLVYNDIPLRLIHVPSMTLMDRPEVKRHVQSRIEKLSGVSLEDVRRLLRYAILSHRWLEGEVLFEDFQTQRWRRSYPSDPGRKKLRRFCEVVKRHDVEFAWADTCCIDKTSSAELDESIRSMFRWYRNSHVCVVYLADSFTVTDLPKDEWFTRGWTLQELLAPPRREFLGADWIPLKSQGSVIADVDDVMSAVARLTGIPLCHLHDFTPGPKDVSQRMSWAAGRQTTRVEDRAYSLTGIFGVSFPIAYGEGEDSAFFRLMEAILHINNDREILNWAGRPASIGHPTQMIPSSPDCYRGAALPEVLTDEPMQLTNLGLRLELLIIVVKPLNLATPGHSRIAQFDCRDHIVTVQMHRENQLYAEPFAFGVWNVTSRWSLKNPPKQFHACLLTGFDNIWQKIPTENLITFPSFTLGISDIANSSDILQDTVYL